MPVVWWFFNLLHRLLFKRGWLCELGWGYGADGVLGWVVAVVVIKP